MKLSLTDYIRQMNESELSGLLHKVVEELNRKKAKRQNVDVGFWDSEGNYKEDIQPIDEHDGIDDIYDQLKAENGKLKEHLSFMDCVEARKEEEKQTRMYFEKLAQKYKQALDEIEKFCKEESCEPCKELEEDNHCDECHCQIILDIINKAKDGE